MQGLWVLRTNNMYIYILDAINMVIFIAGEKLMVMTKNDKYIFLNSDLYLSCIIPALVASRCLK